MFSSSPLLAAAPLGMTVLIGFAAADLYALPRRRGCGALGGGSRHP
jgi:hypothetical protein